MKYQCTVRLGDDYELDDNNRIVVWVPGEWDDEIGGMQYVPKFTDIRVGTLAVLYSVTNVCPDALRSGRDTAQYRLAFDTTSVQSGIPGNSDPGIRRFHGWRGTTNDQSIVAHGLRRIVAIRKLRNDLVSVTVGRDIAPNCA